MSWSRKSNNTDDDESANYVSARTTAQWKPKEDTSRAVGKTIVPLNPASNFVGADCYLNAQLNGAKLTDCRYSDLLKDDMVILRFYHHDARLEHGFVVFETDSRHVFLVHLIGGTQENGQREIFIEIKSTTWRSDGNTIQKSNTTVKHLKSHIKTFIIGFGSYDIFLHNCQHFSRDVANFLAK